MLPDMRWPLYVKCNIPILYAQYVWIVKWKEDRDDGYEEGNNYDGVWWITLKEMKQICHLFFFSFPFFYFFLYINKKFYFFFCPLFLRLFLAFFFPNRNSLFDVCSWCCCYDLMKNFWLKKKHEKKNRGTNCFLFDSNKLRFNKWKKVQKKKKKKSHAVVEIKLKCSKK